VFGCVCVCVCVCSRASFGGATPVSCYGVCELLCVCVCVCVCVLCELVGVFVARLPLLFPAMACVRLSLSLSLSLYLSLSVHVCMFVYARALLFGAPPV